MAQKTLNAFVVIGGRVDNTFGQVGTALINLGSTVDEISQKLINFGKESIEVYRDYEDSMLDAQVALSTTYGRGTRELASVMKTLDAQATEWAASTIFHTDDVANAIAQAAHANWDLDMILTGIPNAMRLAQAGSMDLSEAVDFIIKSVNGAGLGFGDLTEWIDEWTYAANSSAGDVAEFGEAMLKMGNTMKFAGSKEELLTMIAILHDSGTTGAAAGTLLRNSMLRLIAPTKKAADAMAELGVTQEEIDLAMSEVDGDTVGIVKRLEELGFSVYDDTGRLKDFVTIFHDLGKATEGMSDDDKYAIWSAIFPTRTITGGMALIEALTGDMNALYKSLIGGEAEGYGEYAAETMMGGLTGAIETFASKVERLKQTVGEELSDDVTYWTDKLGGFVDSVATMDEGAFSGLVAGLEVVAAAGPGLLIAGTAFRFLGFALGTTTGRIAVAAIGLAALAAAMKAVEENQFKESFGDLNLDMGPINEYLDQITQPFVDAQTKIDSYKSSMETAVQTYTDKSSELASGLISKMVTGSKLTKEEKESFYNLGQDMYTNVIQGIDDGYEATMETITQAMGGAETVGSPFWNDIHAVLEEGYNKAIGEAETKSQELRNAMTSAFEDGVLTGDEVAHIQAIMDELNELLSVETSARSAAEERRLMRKAQTLGIEGIREVAEDVTKTRDAILDETYYNQDMAMGRYQASLELVKGRYINGELVDDAYIESHVAAIQADFDRQINEINLAYSGILNRTFDNAIRTSDLADTWEALKALGISFGENGGIISQAAADAFNASADFGEIGQVYDFLNEWIETLGGANAIQGMIDEARANGDIETADNYKLLLDMYNMTGGATVETITPNMWQFSDYSGDLELSEQFNKLLQGAYGENAAMQAETLANMAAQSLTNLDWLEALGGNELFHNLSKLAGENGLSISDLILAATGFTPEEAEEPVIQSSDSISDIELSEQFDKLLQGEYGENAAMQAETLANMAAQSLTNLDWIEVLGSNELFRNISKLAGEKGLSISDLILSATGYTPEEAGEPVTQSEEKAEEPVTTADAVPLYGSAPELIARMQAGENAKELDVLRQMLNNARDNYKGALGFTDSGLKAQYLPIYAQHYAEAGANYISAATGQDVTVSVDGDVTELTATLDSVNGANLLAYVDGDATDLEMSITDQDGRTLVENVTGNVYELARLTNQFDGKTITVNVRGRSLLGGMAEGGRATEPVIYGEAGPEWFIPERHTKNTAALIAQAAHASGFSLAELAIMNGARLFASGGSVGGAGMASLSWADIQYSGPGNQGGDLVIQVQYSPVINADDADGVEEVLAKDKERMTELIEQVMRDRELYESVVAY